MADDEITFEEDGGTIEFSIDLDFKSDDASALCSFYQPHISPVIRNADELQSLESNVGQDAMTNVRRSPEVLKD